MEISVFTAERVDGSWILRSPALPDVEISVASLATAHDHARAAVADATGAADDEIEVHITPVLPDRATRHLEAASDLAAEISERQRRADRELAAAVQFLDEEGLSQREISVATGLPVYRVRQLARAPVDDSVPLTARALRTLRERGAL